MKHVIIQIHTKNDNVVEKTTHTGLQDFKTVREAVLFYSKYLTELV